MLPTRLLIALFCLFSSKTFASDLNWKTGKFNYPYFLNFYGCVSATTAGYLFDGSQSYYRDACTYPPETGTILLCLHDRFGDDEGTLKSAYKYIVSLCDEYGESEIEFSNDYFEEQYLNATSLAYEVGEANASLPIYRPTRLDMGVVGLHYKDYHSFYYNYDMSTIYGAILASFFGIVMLIATVVNILTQTRFIQTFQMPFMNKIRSYFTIPAMVPNGPYTRPLTVFKFFTGIIPNRLDTLICTLYTVLHIVLYCLDYRVIDTPVIYATRKITYQRYISDRSGIMSFAQIPVLVLFAGRNNILSFITGIPYSSFIQYHKLLARWMFTDAVIHSVAWTIMEKGFFVEELEDVYFACGVAATVLGGLILLFAFHPIRSHFYEIFLYTHIVLVICFIAACWWHANILGYCEWLVAACVAWFLDRVIRLVRISVFGLHTATLTIINETSFMVVLPKPKYFRSQPGQYGYVYFSDPLLWFQGHPFTITNDGENITFFIKSKRGITRKIFNQLLQSNGSMTKTVTIEGPYGESAPISKYDNALLVAGGAGVPGILSHAVMLSQTERSNHVKFIWIHQSLNQIQHYIPQLLKLRDSKVQMDIYLTREQQESKEPKSSSDEGSGEKASFSETQSQLEFVNFKYSRPSINKLIKAEISLINSGSVGIVSCGPPVMVDAVRHVASQVAGSYNGRLDYFEELQSW